jgi:predicted naringenin-chalcone synthase
MNLAAIYNLPILFVLEKMVENHELQPGYGLMSALGPGFSSDQLLLHNP